MKQLLVRVAWSVAVLGSGCGDSGSSTEDGGSSGSGDLCAAPLEITQTPDCMECFETSVCKQRACDCTGECRALRICYEGCYVGGQAPDPLCFDACEFSHPSGYAPMWSLHQCLPVECNECGPALGYCWRCRFDSCQAELTACASDPSCNEWMNCMGPELRPEVDAMCRAGLADTTVIDALYACDACADVAGCSAPAP